MTQDKNTPCWTVCEMCEDYICNIHDDHAADCPCEGVEWWEERGMWPYETSVAEYEAVMDSTENT